MGGKQNVNLFISFEVHISYMVIQINYACFIKLYGNAILISNANYFFGA